MRRGLERQDRRRALWGLVLIVVGSGFLLDQLGLADLAGIERWWPAILMVIGLVRMVAPDSTRQFAEGITFTLLGLWFFACTWHWYGLSYRTAWPLVLVIFGIEMVVGAALDRRVAGAAGKEEHHV